MSEKERQSSSSFRPWSPFRKPSSKNGPGPIYTMLEHGGLAGVGVGNGLKVKGVSTGTYSGKKRWILLVGLFFSLSAWLFAGGRETFKPTCNPYSQNGFLNYAPDDPHANRWTPFTNHPTCGKTPLLLASLLRTSWSEHGAKGLPDLPGDWWKAEMAPDGEEWENVDWARNRTVLVVGDSIQRFNMRYFCEMAGEPVHEIDWDHPWSPPKPATPPPKPDWLRVPEDGKFKTYGSRDVDDEPVSSKRDSQPRSRSQSESEYYEHVPEPFAKFDTLSNGTTVLRQKEKRAAPHVGDPMGYMGHYCHLPGVDLMLIQIFNFGLDEKNFWTLRPDFVPPYTFEDRISMLAKPYVENAERSSTAPDLTLIASALWDTTRFMREDTQAGSDITQALSAGRLAWYRTRVRQAIVHTRKTFPRTHLKWMTHHYPLRTLSPWFFEKGDQKQKPQRPQQKLNRLSPLHHAAMSAIEDLDDASAEQRKALKDVGVSKWGELIIGTEDQQRDDLHPSLLPGGYLWADMLLYDLREAVTSRNWWQL
ncbi:hypothetical protein IAR55_006871 [Kwoniella newhampshirensis]|uniref:Uncharacterized protein n=1 Tax=Kwoniella newhampshirensis TaxID=1651941 RepID=A0AAW0YWP0_9TREE